VSDCATTSRLPASLLPPRRNGARPPRSWRRRGRG